MRKHVFPLLGLLALIAAVILPTHAFATSPYRSHPAHFFLKSSLHKNTASTAAAAGNNLNYGGGPVMGGTANVYAIFWEPTGNVSSNYHNLIERYFHDVGGSSLYSNNNQYTDSSGDVPSNSVLAGTWVDNGSYPQNPLLDSNIQNEVTHAQNVNGWSSSIDNIFFVFTQRNENLCFDSSQSQCASNSFCAYHSYFGSNTLYAAMPYSASFSCNPGSSPNSDDADQTINVTSHEQMEAATDPLVNAWTDSSGNEIGDKCAWKFGTVAGDGSNVNWNGNPYIVQQEWDNGISGCTLIATNSVGSGPYYKIVNRNSGQVLDISGLSTANGGSAIQWPYNGGANQQWQEVAVNGGYKLVNRNSSLLLDDPGYSTTNGTQLDQWGNSNSSNQWWNLVSAGGGYYYLVNQSSGLYADVSGASTTNGAPVIEWPGPGGTNQQWQPMQV